LGSFYPSSFLALSLSSPGESRSRPGSFDGFLSYPFLGSQNASTLLSQKTVGCLLLPWKQRDARGRLSKDGHIREQPGGRRLRERDNLQEL
jgi:hypothetical protein